MNDSPYKPPSSNVVKDISSYPRERNVWIWVIIVYQSLNVLGMLSSFIILRGGIIPVPKNVQEYYKHLGLLHWLMEFTIFIIVLLSIIFLFKLSKLAVRLFIAEVASGIFVHVINIFKHNNILSHNHNTWPYALLGYSIMLLVIAYLFRLQKRGVLQ